MRLINVSTLELEEFWGTDTPKYAILSHTWGREEISLAMLQTIAKHRASQSELLKQNQLMASRSSTGAGVDRAEAVRMMLLSSMLVAMRTGGSYPLHYPPRPHHLRRSRSITDGRDEPHSDDDEEQQQLEQHRRQQQQQQQEEERYMPSPVLPAIAPHPLETKPGFSKILSACKQAASDGYRYLWADTVCIDRSSGYEISEVINSMFSFYQNASVCYAHLEDVVFQEYKRGGYRTWEHDFAASRWFARGWTLQELIAPRRVVFFARDWQWLGTKSDPSLSQSIQKITKIEPAVLSDPSQIPKVCVARRMAWASSRKTTRPEDMAYSLMGIFGISMPLLYGEGAERAFVRLQEEIIKVSDDHTLFAWGLLPTKQDKTLKSLPTHYDSLEEFNYDEMIGMTSILAKSPADFAGMDAVVPAVTTLPDEDPDTDYCMTNKGLKIKLKLSPVDTDNVTSSQKHYLGVLNCQHSEDDPSSRLGMLLTETDTPNVLFRTRTKTYTWLSGKQLASAEPRTVYICQNNPAAKISSSHGAAGKETDELIWLKARDLITPGYSVVDIQAKGSHWNREFSTLRARGISAAAKRGVLVYQLAVVTFWNKHMRRGFYIRILVQVASPSGSGKRSAPVYFVDLGSFPPSSSKNQSEEQELKRLKDKSKKLWDTPGKIRLVGSTRQSGGIKTTRMEDIMSPEVYDPQESGSKGEGEEERDGEKWEAVMDDQTFHPTVTFTEPWEKEYMRTVRATVERKKNVVVLEVTSMLWEAPPSAPAAQSTTTSVAGTGGTVAVSA